MVEGTGEEKVLNSHEKEWEYVEKLFKESGKDTFGGGSICDYPFRSRFEHTKRVYRWLHRLLDDVGAVDLTAMELAVIFHDVGYVKGENAGHAAISADIFKEYALKNALFPEKQDLIEYLIRNHNKKDLLRRGEKDELILIMEADIMDEEGAMRVAWDNMAAGAIGVKSFKESLNRTEKYFNPQYNPMVTPLAHDLFEDKQQFVRDYIKRMKEDLGEI